MFVGAIAQLIAHHHYARLYQATSAFLTEVGVLHMENPSRS